MIDDPRLDEAKVKPILEIAQQLGIQGLRRAGGEFIGPCPVCFGTDRFSINTVKNLYNCRTCGGGDVIGLVKLVRACGFKEALEYLCGGIVGDISPEEKSRRAAAYAAAKDKMERDANAYRQNAINDAKRIWQSAKGGSLEIAIQYFKKRGLVFPVLPKCFRVIENHKYFHQKKGGYDHIHTGPCLITAVQGPDGYLNSVHQTWIDLTQEKGKAVLYGNDGALLDSKKVRGSKQGGAIRLTGSHEAAALVAGEGIETTATAMIADTVPGAMYWAIVDLGNFSGKMIREKGTRWSGRPDMQDLRAFRPPLFVDRLTGIQDGDSNAKETRAKMLSGLRRAMALKPGLVAELVHPGEGKDLNDLLIDD